MLALLFIEDHPMDYQYLSFELKSDIGILKKAMEKKVTLYQYANIDARENKELA